MLLTTAVFDFFAHVLTLRVLWQSDLLTLGPTAFERRRAGWEDPAGWWWAVEPYVLFGAFLLLPATAVVCGIGLWRFRHWALVLAATLAFVLPGSKVLTFVLWEAVAGRHLAVSAMALAATAFPLTIAFIWRDPAWTRNQAVMADQILPVPRTHRQPKV